MSCIILGTCSVDLYYLCGFFLVCKNVVNVLIYATLKLSFARPSISIYFTIIASTNILDIIHSQNELHSGNYKISVQLKSNTAQMLCRFASTRIQRDLILCFRTITLLKMTEHNLLHFKSEIMNSEKKEQTQKSY